MNWKLLLTIGMLCAVLCLSLALFTVDAEAQDSNNAKNSDKDIAKKTGFADSLADGKDKDPGDGPTKTQMWLGGGSCIVMWIVVKYL
jgi:hypothetical protein